MRHETAGDPITALKWTRKTTRKIGAELRSFGIEVSANTVARLLKQIGYRLRVNHKRINLVSPAERDDQFHYIQEQRDAFEAEGLPIVSVDTKKKELIGNFKNPGASWERSRRDVLDHDFRSDAEAIASPYGIYDLQENRGRIFLGLSHDTSEFAVDALVHWWTHEGHRTYSDAEELLILADSGGSNGARVRAWKFQLQHKLCDVFGIAVTVCHYPSGASKWNPVEHRMFGPISLNWQGHPLDSVSTLINYVRTTSTATGLRVRASMTRRNYPTGVRITDDQMAALELERHDVLPKWNYTLVPTDWN